MNNEVVLFLFKTLSTSLGTRWLLHQSNI